ncbi:MAG: hypothetical protein E7016_01840 [Alphaproteobacteria bacterium]|nr:hypothetical protein [Alphaproteobacteria bacterium]
MRKYFLLSAVALMISGTANADNASLTAEVYAKIEHVNQITCSPLDFGTIYLKKNNAESVLSASDFTPSGDIISVFGGSAGYCSGISSEDGVNIVGWGRTEGMDDQSGKFYFLTGNSDEEYAYIDNISINSDGYIWADLHIPANFPTATLDTTISLTVTY